MGEENGEWRQGRASTPPAPRAADQQCGMRPGCRTLVMRHSRSRAWGPPALCVGQAPPTSVCGSASSAGLSGGLGRSSVSSGTSEIKREEKEDEENTSVADNSEEEKKELKPSRNRTRCSLNRSLPSLTLLPGWGHLGFCCSDPSGAGLGPVTWGLSCGADPPAPARRGSLGCPCAEAAQPGLSLLPHGRPCRGRVPASLCCRLLSPWPGLPPADKAEGLRLAHMVALGIAVAVCDQALSSPWPGAGKVLTPPGFGSSPLSAPGSCILCHSQPATWQGIRESPSSVLACLQPRHRLGDLARVMLPCRAAATSCPGGRGLRLPQTPTWDTGVGPRTSLGHPATSRQQTPALISLL